MTAFIKLTLASCEEAAYIDPYKVCCALPEVNQYATPTGFTVVGVADHCVVVTESPEEVARIVSEAID